MILWQFCIAFSFKVGRWILMDLSHADLRFPLAVGNCHLCYSRKNEATISGSASHFLTHLRLKCWWERVSDKKPDCKQEEPKDKLMCCSLSSLLRLSGVLCLVLILEPKCQTPVLTSKALVHPSYPAEGFIIAVLLDRRLIAVTFLCPYIINEKVIVGLVLLLNWTSIPNKIRCLENAF